jgi:hypothetical protein
MLFDGDPKTGLSLEIIGFDVIAYEFNAMIKRNKNETITLNNLLHMAIPF